jgi:hypothetical protein
LFGFNKENFSDIDPLIQQDVRKALECPLPNGKVDVLHKLTIWKADLLLKRNFYYDRKGKRSFKGEDS